MMELQAILGAEVEHNVQDRIAKVIAVSTFEVNNKVDYISEGEPFDKYLNKVLNQDLIHMMGLFNWIVDAVQESSKTWDERFLSVHLDDEDYERASGDRMAQFNVINTIKSICSEFNVPFKEAWLMSYNLVQTNSYNNATAAKIQDDVRILKEIKLKAQKNN